MKPPTPVKPEEPIKPPTENPSIPNVPVQPPVTPPITIIPNETPKDTPKEGEIPKRPDGTPSVKIPPKNGTVTVDENGKWKYTPNKGYVGKDKFIVEVKYPDGSVEEVVVELDMEEPPRSAPPVEGEMTLPKTGYKHDYYTLLGILILEVYVISRRKKDDK